MASKAIHEQENADGTTTRLYEDGSVRVFDASGKIVTTQLGPAASTMGKAAAARQAARKSSDVDELLGELGLNSVAARQFAQIFISGGSQSVKAAVELLKLARVNGEPGATFETAGHYFPIPAGERCPRCGTWNLRGKYDGAELVELVEALRELRGELGGEARSGDAPGVEKPSPLTGTRGQLSDNLG